jgi:hypothetical protein
MRTLSILALLALAFSPAIAADSTAPAAVPPTTLPAVDHQVYLSELPASADLMQDAAANGLTITRIDRTNDQVVVTYSYPDGHTATLGYAKLSAAGRAERVAARQARPTAERDVTVVTSEPEIIYYEPRYRTRYVYRDPWDDFWLPLTLGVGIGWVSGSHSHYGGYYHGGYRGHGGRRR